MPPVTDVFEDAALVYIRLVSQISPDAAAAIEQIHVQFGSHAALRAALVIKLMKMEVDQNLWIPGIGLYSDLLQDYPAALPLTIYAMFCCQEYWSVSVPQSRGRAKVIAA